MSRTLNIFYLKVKLGHRITTFTVESIQFLKFLLLPKASSCMLVRKFEDNDYHSLVDFNTAVFNRRDQVEESIVYRFFKNPYTHQSEKEILVAVDTNNNIVGQILVLPSEFYLDGKKFPVFFGMDFFLYPEYRNSLAGVILGNKFKDLKHGYGIGLTDASLKIFKAFNYKILGYIPKYIKFNFILSNLISLIPIRKKKVRKYSFPGSIRVESGMFIRVLEADGITSEVEYWNKNLIEFTRSREFIEWRYFYYPDKYFVYKYLSENKEESSKPSFFVVRPIVWKKLNCLLLVDYRFNTDDKAMFDNILKSTIEISTKLQFAATITGCSLPSCEKILRKKSFYEFGRALEIVTKFQSDKIDTDYNLDKVLATFADADCDFFYGSDKW